MSYNLTGKAKGREKGKSARGGQWVHLTRGEIFDI